MKTFIAIALSLLSFSTALASPTPAESVRVQSSRNFRVVIIDASKDSPVRASIHETFAVSLAASLQRQGGAPLPVKLSEESDAGKAAEDLKAGVYDAALFFESSMPADVRTPEFAVTRGYSQAGVPARVFHLVLRNDDQSMVSFVREAFGETIKAPRFQEALSRSVAIRVVATAGL
jgi:hypothetical protein